MKALAAIAAAPLWTDLQARMRQWTGIVLGQRDADSALRTLTELAGGRGQPPADYLLALDGADRVTERQRLIDRLAIGATWFLREAAGLHALTSALVAERGTGQPVRIWSAGCSTGQEPYGLAMMLLEAGLRPQILATDINQQALRIATAACYPTRMLAALPAPWQQRYVGPLGPEHGRIQPSVTALVRFAVHNLANTPNPPPGWGSFDAVVCRNVLMYFERARATAVVARLARSCRPGGYVLLSATERPLAWMTDALKEVEKQYDVVLLRSAPAAPASGPGGRKAPPPPAKGATPAVAKSAVMEVLAQVTRSMDSPELVRAVPLLDELLARDPLLAAAHLLRGLALKRRGAPEQAAAALRCARFLFSDAAWLPPYHLALLLEKLGDFPEACEAYRHAQAVVAAGGRSGLVTADGAEDALALTVAEACAARLRVLDPVAAQRIRFRE